MKGGERRRGNGRGIDSKLSDTLSNLYQMFFIGTLNLNGLLIFNQCTLFVSIIILSFVLMC